jgi:hypothetical protein
MSTNPTPAPEPTPAPAAPAAAPSTTTFWQYITSDIGNHIILILIVLGIVGGVIAFNYFRDQAARLAAQEQKTDTLSQKFQAVGTSAVTSATTATQPAITTDATAAFGAQVTSLMASEDAKISALTTAIGLVNAQQTALAQQTETKFTPAQQATSGGALTGYPMEETRKGPALDSVNLHYDPTQIDPNKAFAGTSWQAYQEQFTAAFGDWVKQKDGSYRNTVSLNRAVSKPDPNNPGQMLSVGTESIPITGANTVYSPKGLLDPSQVVIPRWTLGLGLANSKAGKTAYGAIDYRVTNRFGIFAGTADNGLVGGVSVRLDSKGW